jgi:hypothetical protein
MHRTPQGNCIRWAPGHLPAQRKAMLIYRCNRIRGQSAQEDAMAKGQTRTTKEKKKPKADGNKVKQVSAYKAQQSGGKK